MSLERGDFAKLEKLMIRLLVIQGVFEKARQGRKPYHAEAPCVDCRKGTVHYRYFGSRAMRLYCDNVECSIRVMS